MPRGSGGGPRVEPSRFGRPIRTRRPVRYRREVRRPTHRSVLDHLPLRRVAAVAAASVSVTVWGWRVTATAPTGSNSVALWSLTIVAELVVVLRAVVDASSRPALPTVPSNLWSRTTTDGSADGSSVWLVVERPDLVELRAAVAKVRTIGAATILDQTADPRVERAARAMGCGYRSVAAATAERVVNELLAIESDLIVAVPQPGRLDAASVLRAGRLVRSGAVDAVMIPSNLLPQNRIDPDAIVVMSRTAVIAAGGACGSGQLGAHLAFHLHRRGRIVLTAPAGRPHLGDRPHPVRALEEDGRLVRLGLAGAGRRWGALLPRGDRRHRTARWGAVLDGLVPAAVLVLIAIPVLAVVGVEAVRSGLASVTLAVVGVAGLARAATAGRDLERGGWVVRPLLSAVVCARSGRNRSEPGRSALGDRARFCTRAVMAMEVGAVVIMTSRLVSGAGSLRVVVPYALLALVLGLDAWREHQRLAPQRQSQSDDALRAWAQPVSSAMVVGRKVETIGGWPAW